jgi:hypothetical protein
VDVRLRAVDRERAQARRAGRYPLSSYSSPSDAWGQLQPDAFTYTWLQTQRWLAQWTRTYVYEFDETQTPQFVSIFRLQWLGEPARSFPFGATHVDELAYRSGHVGEELLERLDVAVHILGVVGDRDGRTQPPARLPDAAVRHEDPDQRA